MVYAFVRAFKDRNLTKLATKITYKEAVTAGKESEPIVIWVLNNTSYELENVQIISSDRECLPDPKVIPHMNPHQVVKVIFIWRPSVTREVPLSVSISVKANLIKRA